MTFRRHVTGTLARQVAGMVLGLLLVTLVARQLGPQGNGVYALVVLLPTLLSTLLNFGLAPAVAYFLARHDLSPRHAFEGTLRWWALLSLVGLILGSAIIMGARHMLFPDVPTLYLWLGLAAFPFVLLQSILPGILQGRQEFARLNLVTLLPLVVTTVTVIFAFTLLADDLMAAILAFLSGAFCGSLALLQQVRAVLLSEPEEGLSAVLTPRNVLRYGATAHASNVVTFANYRADFYIVNQLLGAAHAGVYAAAVQLAERMWIVAQSVSYVLLPHLAAQRDEAAMRRQTTGALCATVVATAILCAMVFVLGEKLIPLVLGETYRGTFSVLLWLLPGILMGSVSKVLSNTLAARGRTDVNFVTAVVILTVNISASLWLTRTKGLQGAALATSLSYILDGLIKLVAVRLLLTTGPFHWDTRSERQAIQEK